MPDQVADSNRPGWSEADRLAALSRYAVLDTPPEPDFDAIVAFATLLCRAPMAVVSLVTDTRQWFKAERGLGVRGTPLNVSICAQVLLQPGVTVIPDLTKDERFNCNPLVTGEPYLRFYAGCALRTPEGLPLGTLCVLDTEPRPEGLNERQRGALEALSRQVMTLLELRRAVAERDAQVAKLAVVFAQAPAGLAEIAPDGRFLAVNDSSCAMLGRSRDELLQLGVRDVVHPDDLARNWLLFERTMATGETFSLDKRCLRPDGTTVWVNGSVSRLVNEHGQPYAALAALVDVTERKTTEAALRALNAELGARVARATAEREAALTKLHEVQRLESIGQLTGGIAHDFNNMLQAVSSSLELMRRRIEQRRPEEAAQYVEAATQATDRAARLTHRLLAFARRQTLQPRRVEVDELIRGIAELIQHTVGPEILVELRLRDGVWPVLCDPDQLENALLNLAINSRDAMPDGGRLTIASADVSLAEADVAGGIEAMPGDYVEISVADTGTGMDEATRAHAFEPFFTTKPLGQGTGLGLSQLYGFVRQSGGLVRLESAPGEGTCVRLYLPRCADAPDAGGAEGEPKLAMKGRTAGTVLVVEDEAGVRASVAAALRDLGCRVLEAEDGPGGLHALVHARERVDVLVTDVGLPVLNGRQLADAARKRDPGLPVLLITGYAGRALDGVPLAPGMQVIAKPFALQALAARVASMLRQRTAALAG